MNTLTFAQWMTQIDAILLASIGLTSSDLSHAPYRDRFDDECSAADTAAEFAAEWWELPEDVAALVALAAVGDVITADEQLETDLDAAERAANGPGASGILYPVRITVGFAELLANLPDPEVIESEPELADYWPDDYDYRADYDGPLTDD